MSRIRGKDTAVEKSVRRLVHSLGYRYRLHVAELPGKPDLVFPSRRKVIFVHGCFWHRHRCRRGQSMPSTRVSFWQEKFEGNKERDKRSRRKLHRDGWDVLVVWGCEAKDTERLTDRVVSFLDEG